MRRRVTLQRRPTPGSRRRRPGLDLTSPEAIQLNAPRILQQAVDSDIMPLGNETGMTEEERAALGAWIRAGAHAEEGP